MYRLAVLARLRGRKGQEWLTALLRSSDRVKKPPWLFAEGASDQECLLMA